MSEFNYTIVAICSKRPVEDYYCLDEWAKSIDGKNTFVIQAIDNAYGSLCDKPKFVYRAIQRGLIKTKYIIFCDCFDLVFAAPPEEIILKFLQFDADLVISAERNCFPDTYKAEYDKLPAESSYKYLNSGMIVGYTDALLKTLEAMKVEEIPNDYWDGELGKNVHFNDQEYYQKSYLDQPVKIALDTQQVLSQTLHEAQLSDLDFSGQRIRNVETGSYPCTFHMNGNGKSGPCRMPILKHLNLI